MLVGAETGRFQELIGWPDELNLLALGPPSLIILIFLVGALSHLLAVCTHICAVAKGQLGQGSALLLPCGLHLGLVTVAFTRSVISTSPIWVSEIGSHYSP